MRPSLKRSLPVSDRANLVSVRRWFGRLDAEISETTDTVVSSGGKQFLICWHCHGVTTTGDCGCPNPHPCHVDIRRKDGQKESLWGHLTSAECEDMLDRCSVDTTAVDLAQEVEFLKAELAVSREDAAGLRETIQVMLDYDHRQMYDTGLEPEHPCEHELALRVAERERDEWKKECEQAIEAGEAAALLAISPEGARSYAPGHNAATHSDSTTDGLGPSPDSDSSSFLAAS